MRILAVSVLFLIAVAGPLCSDEVKDREPLQGTWKIVSIKSRDKDSELDLELVLKGDGATLRQPGKEQKEQFRFTLDPTVTPKAIDFWKSTDDGKRAEEVDRSWLYEVKGDELKICIMSQPGPPWVRPASLESRSRGFRRDSRVTLRKEWITTSPRTMCPADEHDADGR